LSRNTTPTPTTAPTPPASAHKRDVEAVSEEPTETNDSATSDPTAVSESPNPAAAPLPKTTSTFSAKPSQGYAGEQQHRAEIREQVRALDKSAVPIFDVASSFGTVLPAVVAGKASTIQYIAMVGSGSASQFGSLVSWLLSMVSPTEDGAAVDSSSPFVVASLALVASLEGHRQLLINMRPTRDPAAIDAFLSTTLASAVAGSDWSSAGMLSEFVAKAPPTALPFGAGQLISLHWGKYRSEQQERWWETDAEADAGVTDEQTIETTVCTMALATAVARPEVLSSLITRADAGGFDIVGLRLVFPEPINLAGLTPAPPNGEGGTASEGPVVAFALRRPHAVELWKASMGASDTNSTNLHRLVSCTRLRSQGNQQLTTWFGRQFAPSVPVALSSKRGLSLLSRFAVDVNCFVLMATQSMLPVACLLEKCREAGFVLRGCGRMSMTPARTSTLGLAAEKFGDAYVVKVAREHGARYAVGVAAAVVSQLDLRPDELIMLPMSSAVSGALGDLETLPSRELSDRRISRGCAFSGVSNNEHPLPLTLTVLGPAIQHVGAILRQLSADAGLQVLGAKWVPRLSAYHAKEVTPFEVGDVGYRSSVEQLSKRPVFFVALYGVSVHARVKAIFAEYADAGVSDAIKSGNILLPLTAQSSWRQMAIFLHERDVIFGMAHTEQLPTPDVSKGKLYALGQAPDVIETAAAVSGGCCLKDMSRIMDKLRRSSFEIAALQYQQLSLEQAAVAKTGGDDLKQPRWTLALRRPNAVRCWLDLLDGSEKSKEADGGVDPFCLRSMIKDDGSAASASALHGSSTFAEARAELSVLFPAAVEADSGGAAVTETVGSRGITIASTGDSAVGFHLTAPPFPTDRRLMETTCLVVSPKSESGCSREELYGQIFGIAASKGLNCIGARVVHMSPKRAQAYLVPSGRPKVTVRRLVPGPVLVLALQGDNAVSCTEMLLCDRSDRDSLHSEWGLSIFAPTSKSAAKADLAFFFADEL
jgi:nucleoside diphosphate kinase